MKGNLKGMRDYEAARQPDGRVNDPAIVEILSQWTKIPPEIVAQTAISEPVPNGAIDLDELNEVQAFWVREGLVQTPVDLKQFVDTRYAEAARAQSR
jgi:ABC-type nitrate/sulfonate/bicarbonate transport system substrate-binding protein